VPAPASESAADRGNPVEGSDFGSGDPLVRKLVAPRHLLPQSVRTEILRLGGVIAG
jgi:hypothetical protein